MRTPATLSLLLLMSLLLGAGDTQARRSGARRSGAIDMIVLHSTGGPTCDLRSGQPIWVGAGTLDENIREIEAHPVLGIHYMIDRDGRVRASVPEDQVAHHVYRHSSHSLAIELINEGDGRDPFPEDQLNALVALLRDIVGRHRIPRENIKRHSDLDRTLLPCQAGQRRKVDPGDAFPFESVVERTFGPARP